MTDNHTHRPFGRRGHILGMWLAAILLFSGAVAAVAEAPVHVLVSVAPQADFVKHIAGDAAVAEVLVPPGQSHETYEVTPKQMARIGESQAFFRVGLSIETGLLPKLQSVCPGLRVVDMREGVQLLSMGPDSAGHAHGDGMDPHIWLDPVRVKTQAAAMAATLSALRPEQAALFQANLKKFEVALDALTVELQTTLAPVKGRTLFVYHPAYGYFADRFGLRQEAVEQEGKDPGLRHVQSVAESMRKEGARVLFVQPQFSSKTSEAVAAETGARVVALDPLPKDYIKDLRGMAQTILEGLRRD